MVDLFFCYLYFFELFQIYYKVDSRRAIVKVRLTCIKMFDVINAIDTASYGMAGTITDWIVGPKPKGYLDPMDDP